MVNTKHKTNVIEFNRKVTQTMHLINLTWTLTVWLDQMMFRVNVKGFKHRLSNFIMSETCLCSPFESHNITKVVHSETMTYWTKIQGLGRVDNTIVKVVSLYRIVGRVIGSTFKYLKKVILAPWTGFNDKSVVAMLIVRRLEIMETILMVNPAISAIHGKQVKTASKIVIEISFIYLFLHKSPLL